MPLHEELVTGFPGHETPPPDHYDSRSAALQVCKHKVYNRLDALVGSIETYEVDKGPIYAGRSNFVRDCLHDIERIVGKFAEEHKAEMAAERDVAFVAEHGRPSAEVREAYLARLTALASQGSGHKPYVEGFNPRGIHHFNILDSKYEESNPSTRSGRWLAGTEPMFFSDP